MNIFSDVLLIVADIECCMDKYLVIKKIFEAREDKENALSMAKYMINMSDFYGLPTPKRKSEDISKIQNKII